jgi:hypothetical protein
MTPQPNDKPTVANTLPPGSPKISSDTGPSAKLPRSAT